MDKRNLPQPTQTSNFSAIQSSLDHIESLYIQKKKQCELLQTEVARLNQKCERQATEMLAMQARIDELTNDTHFAGVDLAADGEDRSVELAYCVISKKYCTCPNGVQVCLHSNGGVVVEAQS